MGAQRRAPLRKSKWSGCYPARFAPGYAVSELLPLIEITHSGTLDRGNMDEYVQSTIIWRNETKTLLRIEKLDFTFSQSELL
jgi:hypothetical protein